MRNNDVTVKSRVILPLLCAVLILAGCGGGGDSITGPDESANGGNGSNGQEQSGSGIEAICALPTLGPAVVSAAGGDCSVEGGGAGFDASALCAVPVLGPVLVSGSGGECEGADGGMSPFESIPVEQLEPLCQIPNLGSVILGLLGGGCPGEELPIPNLTTLTPGFICSIPELGEPLAMALGENCEDDLSDLINPGLLCLVPLVGEVLVEASGFDCIVPTVLSNPDVLACQISPLQPILDPLCPLPDPEALCVIPVLGPGLVEPLLGRCPESGGSMFLPAEYF